MTILSLILLNIARECLHYSKVGKFSFNNIELTVLVYAESFQFNLYTFFCHGQAINCQVSIFFSIYTISAFEDFRQIDNGKEFGLFIDQLLFGQCTEEVPVILSFSKQHKYLTTPAVSLTNTSNLRKCICLGLGISCWQIVETLLRL